MVFSFAVLRKRGEFSSQHTGDGEVGSIDTVLYHVGRSMGVGNGSTCALSSGVEGVTGEGEREREAEEGDMGEIKKPGVSLPARSKRRRDATSLPTSTAYSTYDDKSVSYAVILTLYTVIPTTRCDRALIYSRTLPRVHPSPSRPILPGILYVS